MPAVDCQNAEDKEVQDEDQCLRQAHKKMNPSRRTIGDFIALQNWKSTRVKHLEARDRLRSRMTRHEIKSLLERVRSGAAHT